jgi:hypothetical protein
MVSAKKERVALCAGAYHKKRKLVSPEKEKKKVMEFRSRKNTLISPVGVC